MKTTIKLLTIGILFLSLYSCTKKDDNLASPVSPTPVTTSIGEMFSVSVTPVYQYITGLNIPDSTIIVVNDTNYCLNGGNGSNHFQEVWFGGINFINEIKFIPYTVCHIGISVLSQEEAVTIFKFDGIITKDTTIIIP